MTRSGAILVGAKHQGGPTMPRLRRPDPRSITVEGPFIPFDTQARGRMELMLDSLDVPRYVAAGVRGWLEDKAAGRPDATAATTRARYRRLIAESPVNGNDPDVAPVVRVERAETRRIAKALESAGVPHARALEAARALANGHQAVASGRSAPDVRGGQPRAPIMYLGPHGLPEAA
jgi:hypothetical protein